MVGISNWSSRAHGGGQATLTRMLNATIAEADVDSLKLIAALFNQHVKCLDLWHGGFDLARKLGLPDSAEKDMIKKIKMMDESIGEGGTAHWEFFRQQKRELAVQKAYAYARMDSVHNGYLRRYSATLAVLRSFDEALRAMLPLDFKAVKCAALFTIGHFFKKWRFTSPDWAKPSVVGQAVEYITLVAQGKRARPESQLKAEPVQLQTYALQQQNQIVHEATHWGLAPLEATFIKRKLAYKRGDDPNAPGGKRKEEDSSERGGVGLYGAAEKVAGKVADALFRVPYKYEGELIIEDYSRCVAVEGLVDQIAERKSQIERLVALEGAVTPRPETRPVFSYYVHVATTNAPKGGGLGTLGAVLMLSYNGQGNAAPVTIELDQQRLVRTFKNEVELLDTGFFGWRFEEVDEARDRERAQRMKGRGEARLFEKGSTNVFHLTLPFEMVDITGCSIRAVQPYRSGAAKAKNALTDLFGFGGDDDDSSEWLVDKVTVFKANTTGARSERNLSKLYDATGRSWMFQSQRGDSGDGSSAARARRWGGTPVHDSFVSLARQAMVHVVVQLSETAWSPEEDDLLLSMVSSSAKKQSGTICLSKRNSLPIEEENSTTRHFLLHYDDYGAPLLEYANLLDELVLERRSSSGGPAYVLDSVSIWWRSSDTFQFFACHEWIDVDEGQLYTEGPCRMRKTLKLRNSPKSDGCFHVGAPPPPPKPPEIKVRTVVGVKVDKQRIVLKFEAGDEWKEYPKLITAVTWRLQIVAEDGGQVFEIKCGKPANPEYAFSDKKLPKIEEGRGYLWRVAATHPTFGEGAFSESKLVYFDWSDEGTPPVGWTVSSQVEVECSKLTRRSQRHRTEVVHALALGNPKKPPELVAAGDEGVKTIRDAINDGPFDSNRTCNQKEIAFEDAERPPGAPGDLQPLLNLVGDAEVAAGALDLSPLRKGIGLSGAAWFHRPLAILEGFETEFTFKIVKPPKPEEDYYKRYRRTGKYGTYGTAGTFRDRDGKEEQEPAADPETDGRDGAEHRGSDGFAFVLQVDNRFFKKRHGKEKRIACDTTSEALGASGLQLGYGGLTSCFAVQFATWPSCSRRIVLAEVEKSGEGDGEKYLCSLETERVYKKDALGREIKGTIDWERTKRSFFYVRTVDAGHECVDPSTQKVFLAPRVPIDRRPKYLPIEETHAHHCDRVSVQCAGVHPKYCNSSGPEASMASAKTPRLDDGKDHTARIILEKNRFRTVPVSATSDEQKAALEATGALAEGNPSHRLLVYLDDMHSPIINLELDVDDVFGEALLQGGRMFAGFTSGTGRTNASHIIKSWKFFEVAGTKVEAPQDFLSSLFGL